MNKSVIYRIARAFVFALFVFVLGTGIPILAFWNELEGQRIMLVLTTGAVILPLVTSYHYWYNK